MDSVMMMSLEFVVPFLGEPVALVHFFACLGMLIVTSLCKS